MAYHGQSQGYGSRAPATNQATRPGGGGGGGGGGSAGGSSHVRYTQMPPEGDLQLWQSFTRVDSDRSGAITANELQQALVNGDSSQFDLDTVKLLMSTFDTDRSGTIGFDEFAALSQYIREWQNAFWHFDTDRSGSIDEQELSNALRRFGYNLSPLLLQIVLRKYDIQKASDMPVPPGFQQAPLGITFDRFVRACVVIQKLTEAFSGFDSDTGRDGRVQINYDQFMETVLSLP